jgi:hypothetical protein
LRGVTIITSGQKEVLLYVLGGHGCVGERGVLGQVSVLLHRLPLGFGIVQETSGRVIVRSAPRRRRGGVRNLLTKESRLILRLIQQTTVGTVRVKIDDRKQLIDNVRGIINEGIVIGQLIIKRKQAQVASRCKFVNPIS